MNWFYLFIAGIFEIGWPLGFKLSQTTPHRLLWIGFAVLSMALSGFFFSHYFAMFASSGKQYLFF
jgi:quaternary ammonium compound-resistance protein SugE